RAERALRYSAQVTAALLLLAAQAQAATVVVVPETDDAREVAQWVAALLDKAAGTARVASDDVCPGTGEARRRCFVESGESVVWVSVARVQTTLAVSLEATVRRKVVAEEDARGPEEQLQEWIKIPAGRIATTLRSLLAQAPARPIARAAPVPAT